MTQQTLIYPEIISRLFFTAYVQLKCSPTHSSYCIIIYISKWFKHESDLWAIGQLTFTYAGPFTLLFQQCGISTLSSVNALNTFSTFALFQQFQMHDNNTFG